MPGMPQPEEISKRNEALSRKAEMAEHTVHDKGDADHIAAVFQDRQEQETGSPSAEQIPSTAPTPPMMPSTTSDCTRSPAPMRCQEAADRILDGMTTNTSLVQSVTIVPIVVTET